MLNYFTTYLLYPAVEKKLKRDIRSKLSTIIADRKLPKKDRVLRKKQQLTDILSIAAHKVPYYRDLFQQINFDVSKVSKDLAYLQELPFLTKSIIHEQGPRMIHEDHPVHALSPRKTGGSTGISTVIYYDGEALDWTSAINLYAQGFTGRRRVDQEAHLSTNFYQKLHWKSELIEFTKCLAMNRSNIYTDDFSDLALEKLWETIRNIRPYLLQGHPSTLYALALYIEKKGCFDKSAIRVFESTGESLDIKKVKTIETNIGCKVYNRYGTAEFGVTAHSRERFDQLEIIDYIVHHEVEPIENGLKELIGTTTTNCVFPLIRYRSGDVADIEYDDNCDYIVNLQGRIHDIVHLGGQVYPTHYVQDILDRIGGIDEFQILVDDRGLSTINVVLSDESKKEAIIHRLIELFGDTCQISFVKMENLVRVGWRDKFRYVVKL